MGKGCRMNRVGSSGEPDALKGASPVREEVAGFNLAMHFAPSAQVRFLSGT